MEAASHSYLGGQLESIPYSLKHEVEDGRRFDIIMIGLNDVVLFPYETIALRISNETNTDINTILSQHANISSDLIGIVNISQSHVYADIGTLVSVKSKGATTPQSSTVPGDWAITAYGHGRFHVEHTWHWQSLHLATVVVLAEDFGCPVGYSRGSEVFGNYISIRSSSDKSRRGTTGVEHAFPAWIAEARSPFCLARRVWVSLLNSFSPCGMVRLNLLFITR